MTLLVLLGGPTGVGKTTTLKCLQGRVPRSALLDADDVWRISEDLMVDGTRPIAHANVMNVLDGYFDAGCEVVLLSWVFARSQLYQPVLDGMAGRVDEVRQIYLVARPDVLRQRLEQRGEGERYAYSLSRLELISALPYAQIDTSELTPDEVADRVVEHLR